ncbi:MAG: hypothetical protein K0R54_5110 [Clostridiaceae bacterium]|jgi:hypothetical protein|nr:hypothetical protein [Clostridiaceae bacterium]
MNKKIWRKKVALISMLIVSIYATACSNSQNKDQPLKNTSNENVITQNADATSNTETKKTDVESSGKSNDKVNYSSLSGTWVTESNLKNDFKYGIVTVLNVDKDGNVKGQIGNSTENLTHIASVEIHGKIENNKFIYNFEEDNWGHSGEIKLDFKGNQVILTINYNSKSSKNNLWGIGEGTFTLIKSTTKVSSTLNNLKSGGLQVIGNQCFSINLENFGDVRFISGLKRENANDNANFYLVDNNNNVLYKFPDFYGNEKGMFNDITAICFTDVNNDGLKDIVIIAAYQAKGSTSSSFTSISSIYLQKGKEFISNKKFDDELNKSGNNKDVKSVLKFAKDNL